ncbi:MAG: PAS domain-containing protein, partial [Thermoplasmata archaeon]
AAELFIGKDLSEAIGLRIEDVFGNKLAPKDLKAIYRQMNEVSIAGVPATLVLEPQSLNDDEVKQDVRLNVLIVPLTKLNNGIEGWILRLHLKGASAKEGLPATAEMDMVMDTIINDPANSVFIRAAQKIPLPLCIVSKGIIIYSNEALARLLDIPQEVLSGLYFLNLIHPTAIPDFLRYDRHFSETGSLPLCTKSSFLSFSNTTIPVEITALPFIAEEHPAGLILIEDRREKERLLEIKRYFEQLLLCMPHHSLLLDSKNRIKFASGKIHQIFGLTTEELEDKDITSLFPERYSPLILNSLKNARKGMSNLLENIEIDPDIIKGNTFGRATEKSVHDTHSLDIRNKRIKRLSFLPSGDENKNVILLIQGTSDIYSRGNIFSKKNFENWLNNFVQACPYPVLVLSANFEVVLHNNSVYEVIGKKKDEDTTFSITEESYRIFMEEVKTILSDISRSKEKDTEEKTISFTKENQSGLLNLTLQLRTSDGKTCSVDTKARLIAGIDEPLLLVFMTKKDIQDNRAASEENPLLRWIEYGGDLYFTTAMDFTILDVSEGFCDAIGLSKKDVLGKNLMEFVVLVRATATETLSYLESNGKIYDWDVILKDKDEHTVWCSLGATIFEISPHRKVITGALRLIYERKKLEHELEEYRTNIEEVLKEKIKMATSSSQHLEELRKKNSLLQQQITALENMFSRLVSNLFEAVIIINSDQKIVFFNETASHIFRLKGGIQLSTGKSIGNYPHIFSAPVITDIEQVFAGNVPMGRVVYYDAPLRRLVLEVMYVPAYSPDGNMVVFCLFNDVSDTTALEEEKAKVENFESLSLLAGGIAHDFNNIILAILGNISLAKFHAKDNETIIHLLTEAEKAGQKSKELTSQLHSFSRSDILSRTNIDVAQVIKESAEFVEHYPQVKVTFELQKNLPAVFADRLKLERVFHNIIKNSLEAMPEGGSLHISADLVELKKGHKARLPAGTYIKIVFRDSTKPKGFGLGLATSLGIIRKHGGDIEVESVENKGSSFTVFLPCIKPE